MQELVTISNGEARTTSMVIAEGMDVEHKSVIQLVRNYQCDLEEFGRVTFEMRPFETAGGVQTREVALLNEQQATLIMTYMKNTEIARGFKKRLVKAFYELAARTNIPPDPIIMLRMEQLEMAKQVDSLRDEIMENQFMLADVIRQNKAIINSNTQKQTIGFISNPITVRLHARGYTIRTWAEEHGFDYGTVRNVLSGLSQRAEVKKALKIEGLLCVDDVPVEDLF